MEDLRAKKAFSAIVRCRWENLRGCICKNTKMVSLKLDFWRHSFYIIKLETF